MLGSRRPAGFRIARAIDLNGTTVNPHLKNIFHKLGAASRGGWRRPWPKAGTGELTTRRVLGLLAVGEEDYLVAADALG